jgi:hypothetical protein
MKDAHPLKLTLLQRLSLIECARLKPKVVDKLKEDATGTQIVSFNSHELDHLVRELVAAARIASHPHKKRLEAVLTKVAELRRSDRVALEGTVSTEIRVRAAKGGSPVYQFKITLLEVEPSIWRRIRVPNCTLASFHSYLQAAFGWENCHLHLFEIGGRRYGMPSLFGFDDDLLDGSKSTLSDLHPAKGRKNRWIYEYDFGDSWRHEVVFEGLAENGAECPTCVEGERACPPEDTGGPWGFVDYLAALADPKHERHREMLEWRGPFDAEEFDVKKVSGEMRKVK